jgi:hypothetical protein
MFDMIAANGSGTFTGNYEVFYNNGVVEHYVNSAGLTYQAGALNVETVNGFGVGSAAYGQVILGNLIGTYSFYPSSFWTGNRAPIKWVWESNTANAADVGFLGAFFINPTSGASVGYGKTAMDVRTFITDTSSFNLGSGTGTFWTTVYVSNTALHGGTDTVIQIGGPSFPGLSAAGQAAEFDVLNYGTNQSNPTGTSATRGESVVCGNGVSGQVDCTVGLLVYGDSANHQFHRGLEIDAVRDWSLVLPNHIPVGMYNAATTAILNVLELGTSNNLVVGGDSAVTSIEYGPAGSSFLSAAGRAVCVKADGKSFGFCSTATGSTGACTCN